MTVELIDDDSKEVLKRYPHSDSNVIIPRKGEKMISDKKKYSVVTVIHDWDSYRIIIYLTCIS